ncbi:histidine phosphatase family protein [Streptomyces sp. NBC_01591]|uniref:histidine phosphatase family protein n=1 Tax=Streptomyces sp. NBC_01591 TaxID=2975888 RepID=UPI002DD8C5EF|nr:histidine phosphatase family protein [Streptomyces sp. NBC_01591]WSD69996.1 histidine phosphatase family protein [Streptomyces sp. NBC_01591]
MTGTATRHLYLVRHGEAAPEDDDDGTLTEAGRRQAQLLGRRLREHPISVVRHGPLPRAAQTAQLIGEQLGDVPVVVTETADDYVPHFPDRADLPAAGADRYLRFLEPCTAEERVRGPELARRALKEFTGPPAGDEDVHELVVTHSFLVSWLVRDAMAAPEWRWLGLNHGNAALTVIRYGPDRPASILVSNDMRHLPDELCWTGFPPDLRL